MIEKDLILETKETLEDIDDEEDEFTELIPAEEIRANIFLAIDVYNFFEAIDPNDVFILQNGKKELCTVSRNDSLELLAECLKLLKRTIIDDGE